MMNEIFVKTFPGFLSIRNREHKIIYLNENFREWIKEFTDIEPLGKDNLEIATLVPANVASVFFQCHDASLCWEENFGIGQVLKKIIPFESPDGDAEKTRFFDVLKYGVKIDDDLHIFTVGHDITDVYRESQGYLERLESIAYIDDLTGESSFSKFKDDASELLNNSPWQSCALIKLDIENFKLINKTYSFEMGNRVLRAMSDAIKSTLFKNELFARVTTDEFIILCSFDDINSLEQIKARFVNKFYSLMDAQFDYNIKFKVGAYPIDLNTETLDINELLELVNFAHRKAKQSYMSDIVLYDDNFSRDAIRQNKIENKMKKALSGGEFLVYLQPKYRLIDESISSAEALVRWQTSDGQLLSPNSFIPIFEKNGFVTELDMFMLEAVCKIHCGWTAQNIEPVVISVNFSRLHLGNRNFVSDICKIVDKYNIEHKYIEIEFTETTIYENLETFEAVLTALHDAGFIVSMDDFGSGYSSLGLLKNLPVNVIKLDRSFFVKQKDEVRSNIVVGSVIEMAKKLGIDTVAEGIEEKEHIDLLKRLNCDMVQGYYFAKPMPAKDFDKLLGAK